MNMQEFYKKYSLNKYLFAELAHVGTRSLIKYANGEKLRKDTKLRIEFAIRLTEKYNLVYPRFEGNGFDVYATMIHFEDVQQYKKKFELLLTSESAS